MNRAATFLRRFSLWTTRVVAIWSALSAVSATAVPLLLQYQGFISVDGAAFTGDGQFKFALINTADGKSLWSNDSTSANGSEPTAGLTIAVSDGFYSVTLGDTTFPMDALTAAAFAEDAIALRVWFNDGTTGFEQMSPDHDIATVAFAARAGVADAVAEGSIAESALDTAFTDKLASITSSLETLTSNGVYYSNSENDTALTDLGLARFHTIDAPSWTTGATDDAPGAKADVASAWLSDRSEWMIWSGAQNGTFSSDGAIYNPTSDSWTTVSPVDTPEARSGAAIVWTGSQALIWGGFSSSGFLNSGALYDPATSQWTAISTTDAPSGRVEFSAVWTGETLAIFGGRNGSGLLNDGGVYDPDTDTWTALPSTDAPAARINAASALIGDTWALWGGQGSSAVLDDGAFLTFDANGAATTWTAIASADAPSARTDAAFATTGSGLFVWGGTNGSLTDTGAFWAAADNTWTALSSPSDAGLTARSLASAQWTGSEVIVWGGDTGSGAVATGAAWAAADNTWRSLTNANPPAARESPESAWSGSEFLLFGGSVDGSDANDLSRVDPQAAVSLYRKP